MNSADLSRKLRETRPVAGDALRARVRAIAAVEPSRRRSPFARFSPRRLVLVAVPAAAVLVAAVAGITSLGNTGGPPGMSFTQSTLGAAADAAPAASAKAVAGESFATTAPVPAQDRAQRYSAQLTISVRDNDALSQATQSALTTVRRLGGHVVSVQYATAESGTAAMTLRVPGEKVQDALTALTGLGTIVAQNVQIDDLQGQLDELTKRENALRARIARLSARIAAPGLDAETKALLVARRDAARNELGQVRSQAAQVGGEARFATFQLQLQTEQGSALPPSPSRFDGPLDVAARILAWEAAAALYALVVAGPLLLVALAVWLARRLVSRMRPAWR
jgi:hypothetical protein